ncbi:MAG TPA: YaiO family outer membrane beta-barrel protein [Candidatus Bathyarchaeia archaeon]|nr:YaiO family outer membrane beta-barrel protein [Candidatus Bathyarchaeia archaeon]
MTHIRRPGLVGALLGLGLLAMSGAVRAQARDDVRQALFAGSYEKAITLAGEALKADPCNAEIRFLLARAYGYSGRWDEAEAVLGRLLEEHPAETDILVFRGRLLCWRNDLDGARKTFERALELQPRSADAAVGLADLASWRGDYDAAVVYCRRALDLDANHAGALFRMGSVLLERGDYGRARGYFARAAELEPRNEDFARALAGAAPVFARRTEVWLSGRNEHWSDGRPDYRDLGLTGFFGLLHDRARLAIKVERLWRAGTGDDRIGLEFYPQLWKGAYGYVDLGLAPKASFAPSSSVHLEIYQSFLKKLEFSIGGRRMSFATGGVNVAAASAAVYAGAWYPNVRVHWADSAAGTVFTWMAGLRRYLRDTSYVWVTAGHGSRSMDTADVSELLERPAWFGEAGFDLYVLKDIKLRGYVSYREETAGPSGTALALTTGYRF